MDSWQILRSCAGLSWAPGLGDTDAFGLALTLMYVAAAVSVAAVSIRGPFPSAAPRRERWLWLLSAALLLGLALNKQLDLQNFVTATGRCMSRAQGWYDLRRIIQREAVLGLLLVAGLGGIACAFLLRGTIRANRLLLAGMAALIGFVLIRAIAFNHMEQILGTGLASAGVHRVLETLSLAVILWAALARLWR